MPPSRLARARINAKRTQHAIQVEGLTSLNRLLRNLPGELRREIADDLGTIVAPIQRTAVQNVRSGVKPNHTRLASSIRVRVFAGRFGIGAKIGSRVKHAAVREFGRKRTLRIEGRKPAVQKLTPGKFLMRAIDTHRAGLQPKVQRTVNDAIDRIFRESGVERFD